MIIIRGKKTRTSPRGTFLGSCFLALYTLFEGLFFLALPFILVQYLFQTPPRQDTRTPGKR